MFKKISHSINDVTSYSFVSTKNIAALSVVAVIASGCSEAPQQGGHGMQPAAVSVISAQAESVPYSIELPATLAGAKEVEIRARIAGVLQSRNFNEGDYVEAGHSLFTIEPETFETEVSRVKAELTANKARQVQAEKEVKRLTPLRENNSVSQSVLDDAISRYEIAVADVQANSARLKQAQLSLSYTQVLSPISGIVGKENVSEGTFIQGSQQLLTQLTQVDTMRVRFGLSEREQLAMRKDAEKGLLTLPENGHWKTRVKFQDGTFYSEIGEVNFNDVRVNPHTGTSEFQAIIKNVKGSNGIRKLRSGQFVRVNLEGAQRHNAYVVPQRAVLDSGMGKFVYVVKTNEQGMTIASPAPVQVAEWVTKGEGDTIENLWVILGGLNKGDQVIVDGMARIFFPGMPVKVVEPAATNTDSPTASH